MKNLKPFVKWVGGKRQILNEINKYAPKKFNTYYEPFVGGGAFFLEKQYSKTNINDLNYELITTYEIIRDMPKEFMNSLNEINKEHVLKPQETFLKYRKIDREICLKKQSKLKTATRFVYLNKYCFNGLYRVNKKNEFNVPWNKKNYVKLYDKENILNISNYLENVNITNQDFKIILEDVQKNDFVYLDPPYDILKKSTFDNYNKESFGKSGQLELFEVFKELDSKGVNVLMSNHNTPFINEMYKDYKIIPVSAKRMVNSNAKGRDSANIEVLIKNY